MIKVTMLLENTNLKKEKLISKHGLSMYIETPNHKILFDVGPDDSYIKNAKKLNIDLSKVDTLVISHGHSDHGGGLDAFLKINTKAKIYIQKNAFYKHYSKIFGINFNIGLNNKLASLDRIIFTDLYYIIDDSLQVFSDIHSNKLVPPNNNLFSKRNNVLKKDSFSHEQNLLITLGENNFLFCGCAHRGIVNILEKAENIAHTNINYVFGGMHLMKNKKITPKYINNLAIFLLNSKTSVFYTCHCTSLKKYIELKKIMNDKIEYMTTGCTLKFKT